MAEKKPRDLKGRFIKGYNYNPDTEFRKGHVSWCKGTKGVLPTPWNKGLKGYKTRPHSEESKRKMSEARKGVKLSLEHKKKLSLAKIGNTINRGRKHTLQSRTNMSTAHKGKMLGNSHPRWKGDSVGYNALHLWVRNKKGKAIGCEFCGSTGGKKGCHWANVSGEYKRELDDWKCLCPLCHRRYDLEMGILGNVKKEFFKRRYIYG